MRVKLTIPAVCNSMNSTAQILMAAIDSNKIITKGKLHDQSMLFVYRSAKWIGIKIKVLQVYNS